MVRRAACALWALLALAGVGSAALTGQRAAAERARRVGEVPVRSRVGVPQAEGGELPTDSTSHPEPSPTRLSSPCPADMVFVEGDYCTHVRHHCLHWLDDRKLPYARCAQYEEPAQCVGKRHRMRFCIDRYEQTLPGQELPVNYMSFTLASKLCHKLDRRICLESEWNFACEGEQMQPYPYGWSRQPLCNQDHDDLYERNPKEQVLRDLREDVRAHPRCVSPFGVVDMVGNVDEPVLSDVARYQAPFSNALKGGWWLPGRNRCRPATVGHDDHYRDIQVGARCCKDAEPAEISHVQDGG